MLFDEENEHKSNMKEYIIMERKSMTVVVGEKTMTFETGKIARQANGSVLVRVEDTAVFSVACASKEASADIDFFPLRVDYQEKFSSAGKTLGGFIKREGRPVEKEILTCRLIDRPLRPLFPDGYYNEVQVPSYVWSYDNVNQPDVLAICASSAALAISDIPLAKPVGAVRVALINDKYIINPSPEQQKESLLDLVLAGTEDGISMIEGFCNFLTEEQVLNAIAIGHESIKNICRAISKWQIEIGKPKKLDTIHTVSQEVYDAVNAIVNPELGQALRIKEKQAREIALSDVKKKVLETLSPEGEEPKYAKRDIAKALKNISSKQMRSMILDENLRVDGRSFSEIRPIDIEQGIMPRTHGSSLFTRGETQTLAICTLGGENMGQRFENLDEDSSRRFYMQYFFPPFSVGEVGRMGAPGRREIGHGKLAERALHVSVPDQEAFPYTIRLESNITESNGSSSMASVCGGCLAMMDAGVPIKRPVAGIAMGLVLEGDQFVVLSDIAGIEDALGDMDFKITGNADGITAFQMDIKVEGISQDVMKKALEQAREGRIHILNKMLEACPKSQEDLSKYAPRIETIQIAPKKIGIVIGPGGKQIRAIIEKTGVEIDINDDGIIHISSKDPAMMDEAKKIVAGLVAEIEVGKTYTGKVTSVVPFGVFVEVLPGKEGLCHISELSSSRIDKIEEHISEGDEIIVKALEINDRGQVRLSHKATLTQETTPKNA